MPQKRVPHLIQESRKNGKHFTLYQNTDLFRLIVDQIGDEVLVIDPNGNIVYANEAAVKGLGYPKTQLLNKSVVHFSKKKISAHQWKQSRFAQLRKYKKPSSYVLDRVIKGGKIQTINVTAVYMSYQDKEYIVSVARDISKDLMSQDKLKETEKMRALELFIIGMSQEIEYPLKAAREHINRLIEKYKRKDFEYVSYKEFNELINNIEIIGNQIRHSFETASYLAGIHRQKIGLSNRWANLNTMVMEVIELFKYQLEQSDIKIKLSLDKNIPLVAIASIELNQVISNILSNAIQAIPTKGTISLRTEYLKDRRVVEFECQDEGIGIPKEYLPRIFEPFFTMKHRGKEKGKGLGLSIVYSIIKKIHGDISITSSLRQGTTVKVVLPVYKSK